jgi:hypothetical protein
VETISPAATPCANCGAALAGAFCSRCGQKHWGEHGWSLGHFLHELFHEFTHVDSSILGTFRMLLRPGELTAQYLAGRRIAFVNPIRLYLLTTAVFFFFGGSTGSSVEGLARMGTATGLLAGIQHRAREHGIPYEVSLEQFNVLLHKGFSLLIALGILIFSLTLWLVMRRRNAWLAPHAVFAMHCYTFFFLARIVLSGLVYVGQQAHWLTEHVNLDPLMTFVISPYLLLALRRVYGGPWGSLLWKWAVLMVVMAFVYFLALGGGVFAAGWILYGKL